MADQKQTYATHTRWYPMYHFFALPVALGAALHLAWGAIRHPEMDHILWALYAVAIAVAIFASRVMAIRVQDRVIRLELKLRMKEVLPPALYARFGELGIRQLVALRFAGDAEMAGLVERVLKGELTEPKAIKLAIKDWQGDYLRA